MGQSVSSVHNEDKRSKRILVDMNGYLSDNEDDVYLSSRSAFDSDISEPIRTNALSFDVMNPEDLPSYAIRSSSFKQDHHLQNHNVAEIASKRIPPSAWSGHRLLQLSNDKQVTSKFLNAPTNKIQQHVKATENNQIHTKRSAVPEISLGNETGFVPEMNLNNPEKDQSNHLLSDHTGTFEFDSQSLATLSTPTEEETKFFLPFEKQVGGLHKKPDMHLQPGDTKTQINANNNQTLNYSNGIAKVEKPENGVSFDFNASPGERKILPLKRVWRKKAEKKRHSQIDCDLPPPNSQQNNPNEKSEKLFYLKSENASRFFTYTGPNDMPSPDIYKNPFPLYNKDTSNKKDTKETESAQKVAAHNFSKIRDVEKIDDNKKIFTTFKTDDTKKTGDTVNVKSPPTTDFKIPPVNFDFSGEFRDITNKPTFDEEAYLNLKSAITSSNKKFQARIEAARGDIVHVSLRADQQQVPVPTKSLSEKTKGSQPPPLTICTKPKQKAPVVSTATATPTKPTQKAPIASTTTAAKAPANKKAKKKKRNEMPAPGGFLSSDITLFDNPISPDEFICLFCQYDILTYGMKDARKKNGYYRRRREKIKKLKELVTDSEERT